MEGVSREVPVLIVGGGPVGLMLAAELGWRGIANLLVERDPAEERLKFSRLLVISVRTMELLRRLGASERVRNWGFPPDHPLDNVFVTSLTGYELGRFKMYSLGEAKDDPFSPEHQWHCPQVVFDPILQEVASSYAATKIDYRTNLIAIEQDDQRVVATIEKADGTRERIAAQYLVGCDGFGGSTRKLAGIGTHGTPLIDHSLNIEFRVDNMAQYHDKGTAGRYICMDAEGTWGTCMVVDGQGLWRILMYGDTESLTPREVDRVIRRLMGGDFPFEVVSCVPWSRRALIADHFRRGRVFLAGDAAHVHPPNGGFGMNTGIGDASDLGWKLEAVIRGWGAPALLDSYERERIPVCERVIEEAMKELRRLKGTIDLSKIAEASPAGEALRQRVRERLQNEFSGSRVWHRWGIHLGAIYESSPIIASDGTTTPVDDTYDYTPSTRPGSRAPHLWLRPGVSILDLFGRHHVLLRFGEDAPDVVPLRDAALSRGMPLDIHTITDPDAAKTYERKLVLVRPDGYVAWRGNTMPNPLSAIDRIRGATPN
ncbi:MAG TPA: FAD-dependent monooxygenase [Stellaceae bacterium]|jgi:2-polyprenyl-6-methoxyphenol hydroxylase-like FAD-dependent oxidoreductase|nr:FAD-dependent monooxygenase [Stellaceae bacterium]